MKIKPLNDWAVIIPEEALTRTAGGLYIPDSAKEKPAEGTVEAIGPGALEEEKWEERKKEKSKRKERTFIPTSVQPGERVMYDRFAGRKIEMGGVERVLVREKNILGILPPGTVRHTEDPPLLLPSATSSSASSALMVRKSPVAATGRKKAAPGTKKTANKKASGKAAKPKKKTGTKKTAKKAKKKR